MTKEQAQRYERLQLLGNSIAYYFLSELRVKNTGYNLNDHLTIDDGLEYAEHWVDMLIQVICTESGEAPEEIREHLLSIRYGR